MLKYEDLYEVLRREKTNEALQKLSSDFMKDFSGLIHENKSAITNNGDYFAEDVMRYKKQYENSMVIFKELMLRRRKKLLNLVFIANETGVMKKDFENMLSFEKDLFDSLLSSVEQTDKLISMLLLNGYVDSESKVNVLITEDVESFVDMSGDSIGPFSKGETVSLDGKIANILVSGRKAVSV
jgi:DNA replication initiation complex subunit (GINS family)